MSLRPICCCLLLGIITATDLCEALAQPSSGGGHSFSINLHDIVATVNYDGTTRELFKNNSDNGSPIKAVYEPAFFAIFNPVKSAPGKLCLTIFLDTAGYRAAANQSASRFNPALLPITRLPITSAVYALGPNSPSEPPYPWVAAKTVPDDSYESYDITFDVASSTLDVADVAKASSLRVTYGVLSEDTSTAVCTITLDVTNDTIFTNSEHGPVQAGDTGSVLVTRNQLADAVSRGWIRLSQECRYSNGQTTQAQLARDAAANLLPLLISQVGLQEQPYEQAVKQLANFSFDGADAKTEIDNYLKQTSDLIAHSDQDHVHVSGSASANVLGLFGGSASADVDTQHVETSLNATDSKVRWKGQQIIPASLNVMTLRSGKEKMSFTLSAAETVITGTSTATRSFIVPLDRQDTVSGADAAIPLGAVVPFWLSQDEIKKLAPTWLPADGSAINDKFSPLNGRDLPRLSDDRLILGTSAAADVIPNNEQNIGGTLAYGASMTVAGTTSLANLVDHQVARVSQNKSERFVIDTATDELEYSNHNHTVSMTGSFSKDLPRQPFRRLIYMVRVRF